MSGLKTLTPWYRQDPGSEAGGGTLSVGVAYNCPAAELRTFYLSCTIFRLNHPFFLTLSLELKLR